MGDDFDAIYDEIDSSNNVSIRELQLDRKKLQDSLSRMLSLTQTSTPAPPIPEEPTDAIPSQATRPMSPIKFGGWTTAGAGATTYLTAKAAERLSKNPTRAARNRLKIANLTTENAEATILKYLEIHDMLRDPDIASKLTDALKAKLAEAELLLGETSKKIKALPKAMGSSPVLKRTRYLAPRLKNFGKWGFFLGTAAGGAAEVNDWYNIVLDAQNAVNNNSSIKKTGGILNKKPYFKEGGNLKKNIGYFLEGNRFDSRNANGTLNLNSLGMYGTNADELNEFQRKSLILGNFNEKDKSDDVLNTWGQNPATAQAYALDGHMGRREMRRLNAELNLGMNRAQRRAFRHTFNNNASQRDQQLINLYYAGLDNSLTDKQQEAKIQWEDKRKEAYKKGFDAYIKDTYGASDAFLQGLNNIQNIKDLLNFLISSSHPSKIRNGKSWAPNDGNTAGLTDGKFGNKTLEWSDAYLTTLNPGERNAYLEMLQRLKSNFSKKFVGEAAKQTWALDPEYVPTEADMTKWIDTPDAKTIWNANYGPTNNSEQLTVLQALKNGGTLNMKKLNYFLEGGAMPQSLATAAPELDIQQQVIQLVQAAMSGDEKANLTINQIMQAAQLGDQQAVQIAQMIQEVAKQIQGQAQSAKQGAKLSYLKSLRSGCPVGTEAMYYKKGGHICKACVMAAKKGTEVPENKCGGKSKATKHANGGRIYFS